MPVSLQAGHQRLGLAVGHTGLGVTGAAAMEEKQRAALKSVCVLGAGLFTDLKDVPELCPRLTGGGACLACSRPWVQSSILGRTNVFGGWQRWQTAAGKSQAANLGFAAQMVSRTVTNNM